MAQFQEWVSICSVLELVVEGGVLVTLYPDFSYFEQFESLSIHQDIERCS
jgi:hypothetical protein